jgi:tellurite resistance protein
MNAWMTKHEPMPAGFFGIAVGTLALAGAWRVAAMLWEVPAFAGTALTVLALVVWAAVMAMYGLKWVAHREAARKEWQHEVQSSFVALGPVSTMLAAQAVKLWSHDVGLALFVAGAVSQIGVGVMLHGRLWQGGRNAELVTPAIYLPTVAAGFVAATTAAAFGLPELAVMFFGSGALSWLAIESKLLNRAALAAPTAPALRPTFGVQLAPPVVGGVAWMAIMSSMHVSLTGAAGIKRCCCCACCRGFAPRLSRPRTGPSASASRPCRPSRCSSPSTAVRCGCMNWLSSSSLLRLA